MSPPTLETERLRLRPYAPDLSDLDAMRRCSVIRVSMRWYPAPFDRDDTRRWIERQLGRYERDGTGLLAIEDLATGEVLGDCGPSFQEVDGESCSSSGGTSSAPGSARVSRPRPALRAATGRSYDLEPAFLISLIRPENVGVVACGREAGVRDLARNDPGRHGDVVYRFDPLPRVSRPATWATPAER